MIEIIHAIENEDDITAFFKIMIDEEIFEWHGDCPKDAEPQMYFEAMADKIHFLILGRLYPDADWPRFKTDENTELEAMQAWIADGCRNKIIVGYYKNGNPKYEYQVIEKQPWRSTHPPGLALKAEVDSASTLADLKEVVKKSIIT